MTEKEYHLQQKRLDDYDAIKSEIESLNNFIEFANYEESIIIFETCGAINCKYEPDEDLAIKFLNFLMKECERLEQKLTDI